MSKTILFAVYIRQMKQEFPLPVSIPPILSLLCYQNFFSLVLSFTRKINKKYLSAFFHLSFQAYFVMALRTVQVYASLCASLYARFPPLFIHLEKLLNISIICLASRKRAECSPFVSFLFSHQNNCYCQSVSNLYYRLITVFGCFDTKHINAKHNERSNGNWIFRRESTKMQMYFSN